MLKRLTSALLALLLFCGPAAAGFEFATGTLNIGTGAATTTYSVTGKSPATGTWKAVVLWWSGRPETTDASSEVDIFPGIGFATSSTSRRASTAQGDHAQGTSITDSYLTDVAAVATITAAPAVNGLADFVSFNSDGFTLVIDDAFSAALEVGYALLGGTDLTDAAIVTFNLPTGIGSFDVTTVGFQGDFILAASIHGDAVDPPEDSLGANISIGAATASAQAVLAFDAWNGAGTSITDSYARAGEIFAQINDTGVPVRVSFTEFLSNGFRMNLLEADGTALRVFALVLKGGTYGIGDFLTATDTTAFTEAHGLSSAPKGAMFFSANRAASTQDAQTAHAEWSVGASDGSANVAHYIRDKDNAGTTDSFAAVEHNEAYINASSATTQVIEGLGHVNSFDATNINFQMSDADPSQSFVWYAAFADAPAAVIAPPRQPSFQHMIVR